MRVASRLNLRASGRQPFGLGLARGLASTRRCIDVTTALISRAQPFRAEALASADFVAIPPPDAHRDTTGGAGYPTRTRAQPHDATLCCYGLYAPLNRDRFSLRFGVEHHAWVASSRPIWLLEVATGRNRTAWTTSPWDGALPRLQLSSCPIAAGLPPLGSLRIAPGGRQATRRVVGYTEASRGCKHVVPALSCGAGLQRPVPGRGLSRWSSKISGHQVEDGAQHITFGDPDFFNGVGHADRGSSSPFARDLSRS